MSIDVLAVYPCLEEALSQELGIPIEMVATARRKHLHRGADWDRVRSRIRLTTQARERLIEVLKAPVEPNAPKADSAPNVTPEAIVEREPATSPFQHSEAELCTRLGISDKQLRQLRTDRLRRGVDWELVTGKVRLSQEGLERLIESMAFQATSAMVADFLTPPVPVEAAQNGRRVGGHEELVCFKCYKINRLMLEAKTAADELVLVRVRDNSNFQPGMKMKCRYTGTRVWELAQRLPRYRGRW